MSSTQFYELFAETKSNQIAVKFGFPNQIKTFRNATFETAGVKWIYRDAV